jgi:glycosyltransferase involved in cell wall biosynthesis
MKIDPDYVIWIGSVFSDEQVLNNIAISPAGNKWQLNFINALSDIGIRVLNIGHCPQRVYPFGKIFMNKRETKTPENIKLFSSSYLNLPFLRVIELNILYTIKLASRLLKYNKKPIYVIGFNTYRYNVIPLLFAKYIGRIKWISLVADPMYDSSNKINPFNLLADGKVFLSYELFLASSSKKKIHLDGGIVRIIELNREMLHNKERTILYSGSIARHTGVELLVNAFSLTKNRNIRLVICGKGDNEILKQAVNNNDRITFLGMVDEQKLLSIYASAFLFINPRLINEKTNNSNFPSKLLEYLSYCKPVISTYTGGISPVYKEIVQFVYNDNSQELADKIDEITSWDDAKYIQQSDKIKTFMEKYKKLSNIVREFNEWAIKI